MSRSSTAAATLIALLVNVAVGLPFYFWATMSSYFMNDLPDADDNLNFLRWGISAALLSATVLVLLSVKNPGVTWRVVAFAAGTSAAVNGAWLAYFFGSDVDSLADDTRTAYGAMTRSTLTSIVVNCVVVAVVGVVVAVMCRPMDRATAS